jgi:transposase-like protein
MSHPRKNLDMAAIIAEYKRGDSMPTLARRHGVHFATIQRRLKEAERDGLVQIRTVRGGQLTRFYGAGDLTGLAAELDVDEDHLAGLLVKYGVIQEAHVRG